ncbi:hypothetical protein BH10PSE7_BH10PSE7_42510 [soil metagenome]
MPRVIFLTLFVLILSGPAAAEDCANAETQTALDECADQEFKAADAALNKAYKSIAKRLADDQDTRKLFVTAQKAWIEFRDAECEFSTSAASDGSIYAMLYSNCLAGLSKKRTADFQRYLSCEEGDLGCPVPPQ